MENLTVKCEITFDSEKAAELYSMILCNHSSITDYNPLLITFTDDEITFQCNKGNRGESEIISFEIK